MVVIVGVEHEVFSEGIMAFVECPEGKTITPAEVLAACGDISASLQRIPQYVEVLPNIEANQIISYFSAVLSYQSNSLLLKDESKLMLFLWLLAGHLLY